MNGFPATNGVIPNLKLDETVGCIPWNQIGEVGKKRQQKMWTNTCDFDIVFVISGFHGEGTF